MQSTQSSFTARTRFLLKTPEGMYLAHMKGQMIDDNAVDLTVTPEEAYQYCDHGTAARMAREIQHIYPGVQPEAVLFKRESPTKWVAIYG